MKGEDPSEDLAIDEITLKLILRNDECEDLVHLAQDRDQLCARVNTEISLLVH
jgi:hypothetical protein